MRLRLGRISCFHETELYVKMMNERESDHRNWIQELEKSVDEETTENMSLNQGKIDVPIVERISQRIKDETLVIVLNLEGLKRNDEFFNN